MKNKTTYWSLGFLAVFAIGLLVCFLVAGGMYAGIGYMILLLYAVGVEICVLLILGLVWHLRSRKESAIDAVALKTQSKHFLLAAVLVLLVGFSVCVGGGALLEN